METRKIFGSKKMKVQLTIQISFATIVQYNCRKAQHVPYVLNVESEGLACISYFINRALHSGIIRENHLKSIEVLLHQK